MLNDGEHSLPWTTSNHFQNYLQWFVMKTFSDKKAINQPMAMVASVNRYQQYQPLNRQRHKACKGKALESNKSSNKNVGKRSYTYITQQSGSLKVICRYCRKDGQTKRVCWFKQAYLNKAIRPQAYFEEVDWRYYYHKEKIL